MIEQLAQQEAWIERSANVTRWPEARRYRSEARIKALKDGGDDEEPSVSLESSEATRMFNENVRARVKEILGRGFCDQACT